ncbi:MAG: TonB-dependent receptor [Kaiparowitsia implicata GSE-PSE-MK54-09C]|jgi:iron complex outermembrane receptor protein|nr:TonB-dependent receptor [Kaiparowitsia implicata GSE-PSE-MK54-09C]
MKIGLQNRDNGKFGAGMLMRFSPREAAQMPFLVGLWVVAALVVIPEPVRATEAVATPPTEVEPITPDEVPQASAAAPGAVAALSDLEQPATTVADWMTQIAQSVVQITDVRVETTEAGLQVVLETAAGELSAPTTRSLGNALIAEFPNAVLALPDGGEFEQFSPAEGIALVTATNLAGDTVQVTITGVDAAPTAAVSAGAEEFVLNVVPGSETNAVTQDDAIQVLVTATRREEPLDRIPRSVTVVEREDIEQQASINRNLREILALEIPGFGPPNQSRNEFGQRLRGRGFQVLIDGVPQNSNAGARALNSISPDAVERIEVIRGPNAIYGAQATGGTINIITRRPSNEPIAVTVEAGLTTSAASNSFFEGDSIANYGRLGVSGTLENFDYGLSVSREEVNGFYDSQGDRIFHERPLDDSLNWNILGTFGLNLGADQRLQLSANHYDSTQNSNYIVDPSVDEFPVGTRTTRGIRVENLEYIGVNEPRDENTFVTLTYTHGNLLGSEVQAQAYYTTRNGIFARPGDDRGGIFDALTAFENDFQNWGGRLQIATPLFINTNLLWGVDYNNDTNESIINIGDPEEFDATSGRVFRRIGERTFLPRYTLEELGLFGQLDWDITDRFLLSGGARYANIYASIPDYTSGLAPQEVFPGIAPRQDIEGGTLSFDDVLLNIGGIYRITDELSLFASFSQGFSIPSLSDTLGIPPAGFSVEGGFVQVEPQKVDNYEIGIRSELGNLQASLSGFYSYSVLGAFRVDTVGRFETGRSPQRNYGVEATLDWQPGQTWLLGTTASWQEGDRGDDSGEFVAIQTPESSPFKLTAYIENQTTPGWRNRLQALLVGDRDRAFNDGIDRAPYEGYVVVDFISSVQVGSGTLNIGIENLLNEDYSTIYNQFSSFFANSRNAPARGRTLSVTYRITF